MTQLGRELGCYGVLTGIGSASDLDHDSETMRRVRPTGIGAQKVVGAGAGAGASNGFHVALCSLWKGKLHRC